jgi:AraC-like DNA-binding protein
MSHSTLYRKIKALVGVSVNEFIRKIKMKQAEELLLTGEIYGLGNRFPHRNE